MRSKLLSIIFVILYASAAAQSRTYFNSSDYVQALKQATDLMVNDVASPIAASRYYAYISICANEALTLFDPGQPTLSRSITAFNKVNVADSLLAHADPALTSILCVYKSAVALLPSGRLMKPHADSIMRFSRIKMSRETVIKSATVADSVVAHVMRYASGDGFARLSGYRRYSPTNGDGYWQPTPPAFMSALEPYWNTLRPFTLDSACQFKPPAPVSYNTDTTSKYFSLLKEVYLEGTSKEKDKQQVAMFWDCNPFALQQMGHLEFGIKKISPGGHWMGITGIACLRSKKPLSATAFIHAVTALTLADAFISCWDEKYRSNRVRPETGIRRLIDPMWQPLLQTPPFPEYPSGHSVVSTAAATVLTQFFGRNFTYVDNTEEEFGLPPRKFRSFLDAANEASVSRLYGGIHYSDAIENGIFQGRQVGEWVIERFRLSSLFVDGKLSGRQ